MKKSLHPFLYIFPAFAIVALFRIIPIFYAIRTSSYDWGIAGPKKFLYFNNYITLFKDPTFWQSLLNTVYYALGTVIPGIILALLIALLLNQRLKGLGIYRTIYFLPVITSIIAVAMVWKWIYHPRIGLANHILNLLGSDGALWLDEDRGVFKLFFSIFGINIPNFLGGPSLALISIIIMGIWKGLGYNIIIFLAGLQNIPSHYYEATKIDGASKFSSFRHITLPMLSPTTFYVLIISTITSFQVFAQVWLMTGPPAGGPLGTTKVLVYYLYEKGFIDCKFGYSAAIAFTLFLIILTLTLFQKKFEKRVFYA